MNLLIDGPKNAKKVFLFAHGAGAPMNTEFMTTVAQEISSKGILVVRFNFPYMEEAAKTGKRRPPNGKKVLLETWQAMIQMYADREVYIGGKSMGGRMATLLSDYEQVKGILVFGFPFHAPGKAPKDRIDHLKEFSIPLYIFQGERDPMGNYEEVKTYSLSSHVQIEWMSDGDHSLKPRKKSGFTQEMHIKKASDSAAKFIQSS